MMDTKDPDNSNKITNADEQCLMSTETAETNTNDSHVVKENNIVEEKAEITASTTKQTIEILKVEFVTVKATFNNENTSVESKNILECVKNMPSNEVQMSSLATEMGEERNQKESALETYEEMVKMHQNEENERSPEIVDKKIDSNLETNEMETADMNVPSEKEGKEISEDKAEKSTMNISESNVSTDMEEKRSQNESVLETYEEMVKMHQKEENEQSSEIVDKKIDSNQETNEMDTTDKNVPSKQEGKEISEEKTEKSTMNFSESNVSTSTGLSLLAQYDSESEDKISDDESVIEVPTTSAQDYRNQVVEIDSNSDSDDSNDSSDVEYLNVLRKTIEKRIEVADDDDEEDEEGNSGKKKHTPKLRVKGEMLLEDLPPIQDLQITVPEDECIEFGKIHSIVDQLVLVSALPNSILLDLETVIFLEKGQKVLGEVFDVLGQVADPLYCVRFNSNKQIKEKEININDVVYVAPKTQYTQYVILSNLMKLKGSDASWENDMEPPPRFLDYSDDEQEQLAKRQLRNKDRPTDNDDPTKRPRTMDDGVNNMPNRSHSNTQQRNRYNEQRNNNRAVSAGHFNANTRPRYNGPQHKPQRTPNPNHYRSSWHSNYYPQSFPLHSPGNYGISPGHNQQQPSQAYASHVPMYAMSPMQTMPYPPPPQATQYGAPSMIHQQAPHLMSNTYSVRTPTLHGPSPSHLSHQQQYTSPPPPGSQ